MNKHIFLFPVLFLVMVFTIGITPVKAVTVSEDITLKTTNNDDITMLVNSQFDSMTVGTNSFTFTLSGSQSVSLRDSDAQILKTNVDGVQGSCDGASSSVTLQASKALSFIIYIEGFGCSSGAGGGGGGGGGSTSSTQTTTTTATTQTTTTTATPAPTTQTASPYIEGAPAPVAPSPVVMPTVAFPGVLQITRRLSVGSTGEDVRALQEALASMLDVYPEGTVSGYFGALTKAAVAKFQMKYGLVSSSSDAGYGSVGPMTRAKLMEVFGNSASVAPAITPVSSGTATITHELKLGDSSDDVTKLQVFLAADASLYPEGRVTGYYGSLTVAAVKRFQAKYGISQVGRVGPQTLAKLNELMAQQGAGASIAPSTSSDDSAAREALQKQITDLQALMESLTQQVQAAQ